MNLKTTTILCLLLTTDILFAQTWLDLKESGANFYQIKQAFDVQYTPQKMKEISKELRKELQNPSRVTDKFEKEMEGVIHFKRWSNWVEPRVRESGGRLEFMAGGITRAIAEQSRGVSNRSGATWSLVGPKSTAINGGNGRVNALRVHPTNSNVLFACVPAGGLWQSTTGGSTWTPISDNIAVLGATDVAFDPTNPNTMYLVTGDGEAGDAVSTGVYKSTNGGASWSVTGLTFGISSRRTLSKILINPTTGAIIVGGSAGIYRSLDGGATWTQTSTKSVRDLEFQPNNPTVVYAGGYGTAGFSRSADGGATWTTIASIPTTGVIRVAVAVTALDPTYVYCLVGNNVDYGLKGVYLSTDGGLTFTLKSSTPNILGWNAAGDDFGGQAWYDLTLAVDPSVKTTIYTGGVNVWKSTTSGATWSCVAHWSGSGAPYIHADNHDLVFSGSTLWVANDGGVFCSANGGLTWTDKSGNLPIAQLYGFGQSATNASRLVCGHQDNGTTLTTNGGTSFTEVLGGDGMMCFIDRTNDNNVFASIYYGELYRSTNGGTGFSYIYSVPGGDWVTPWMQDPTAPTTLYAGGTNVYKSTNNGSNWASISSTLSVGTILQLDVAPSNNLNILASTSTRVIKTINGGTSWVEITAGLPAGTAIQSVRFSPTDPNKIYVCLATYGGNSIYCSTNGGTTWASIATGLPAVPANCLAFDSNGDVYCGTDLGVYFREATATTWAAFTNGMPGISVTDLDIFVPTGKLRASTYGRGLWESPLNRLSTNINPSVSLTSPANSASFTAPATVSMAATASDTDGTVTKVDFYNGTTLLGTSTVAPYSFTWSNVVAGNYALTAKATDNAGGLTTSPVVNITVLPSSNTPPSVSITSPTNNASFAAPATVSIAATASDIDGTIAKVEFYNGTTLLGTSIVAPYSFAWTNVAAGIYTLTAKATDNAGEVTTSAVVNMSVTIQNDAGISAIIAPSGSINTASVTPSVTLKNFGANTITSAQILYRVDANANTTYNWTGSLAAGTTLNVSLPAVTSYAIGNHTFTAATGTVNGLSDPNVANNTVNISFTYTSCSNDNETANNSASTAPVLALNTVKNSQIGSTTDNDYYKFTTTTASPKIKITLTNLPADYDLRLYKAKTATSLGTQVGASQQIGSANETIVYNTPTAGATYFVRVNGYNRAFSTTSCYSLLVQTSNTAFSAARGLPNGRLEQVDLVRVEPLSVYPNPAHDLVNIKFIAEEKMDYNLSIINTVGKTLKSMPLQYEEGENYTTLPTDDFPQGIYFIKISNGTTTYTQKLIIE